ncbi:TetR/AcrR family transcriptional regulator [Microbacterium sp. LWO14-1.2]|uniref:TetR/AcrR family transcriptional regulator n=1 Tax=Microbacterium sp. LWO14-1.2 TaxID=3135263 RepID=UPI0031394C70
MTTTSRAGRPKASSRETLAEAACELFLERGYDATSVADITQRAGVSRSSFFNYFSSKSDVLWSGLDARIDRVGTALGELGDRADAAAVRSILVDALRGFAPDPLALALRNRTAMGLDEELARDSALRLARLASIVASAASGSGVSRIRADVVGAAHAAAVLSSLRVWAEQGAGYSAPETVLADALSNLEDLRWG